MTALMGPTCSGKTLLLSIVSGDVLCSEGVIYADAGTIKKGDAKWKMFVGSCGFVRQGVNVNTKFLTVREYLLWSYWLRCKDDEKREEEEKEEGKSKKRFSTGLWNSESETRDNEDDIQVHKCLERLGLWEKRDYFVGSPLLTTKDIVSIKIAVETIWHPSYLLVDDCFSSLDRRTTVALLDYIKNLSNCCTLVVLNHPTMDILQMFKNLMLLSISNFDSGFVPCGGVCYYGPIADAIPYFAAQRFDCPKDMLPTDFLMQISLGAVRSDTYGTSSTANLDKWVVERNIIEIYAKSQQAKEMTKLINDYSSMGKFSVTSFSRSSTPLLKNNNNNNNNNINVAETVTLLTGLLPSSAKMKGFFFQLYLLTIRHLKVLVRDPAIYRVHILRSLILALVIGFMFYDLKTDQSGASKRMSVLFLTLSWAGLNSRPAIKTLEEAKISSLEEVTRRWYFAFSNYVAMILVEIFALLVETALFVFPFYFIVKFQETTSQFIYFASLIFGIKFFANLWTRFWILLPIPIEVAAAIGGLSLGVWYLFSGYLIGEDSLDFTLPIYQTSIFRYCLEGLASNEVFDLTFECSNTLLCIDNYGTVNASLYAKTNCIDDCGFLCNMTRPRGTCYVNLGTSACAIPNGTSLLNAYDYDGNDKDQKWYCWNIIYFVFIPVMLVATALASYCFAIPIHNRVANFEELRKKAKLVSKIPVIYRSRYKSTSDVFEYVNRQNINNNPTSTNDMTAALLPPNQQQEQQEQQQKLQQKSLNPQSYLRASICALTFSNISIKQTVFLGLKRPERSAEGRRYFGGILRHRETMIMRNITGYLRNSMMICLIGPSGTHKSSLLRVLAGRPLKNASFSGDIKINNQKLDHRIYPRICSYSNALDQHCQSSTVREELFFSSILRLPGVDISHIIANIEEILVDLNLKPKENFLISWLIPMEVKFLSIGVELAADCNIFFFDKPLVGLDNVSADTVVNAIRKIANRGRAVMLSASTMSFKQISICTHSLVINGDGDQVYFGETGPKMVTYFQTQLQTISRHSNIISFNPNGNIVDEIMNALAEREAIQSFTIASAFAAAVDSVAGAVAATNAGDVESGGGSRRSATKHNIINSDNEGNRSGSKIHSRNHSESELNPRGPLALAFLKSDAYNELREELKVISNENFILPSVPLYSFREAMVQLYENLRREILRVVRQVDTLFRRIARVTIEALLISSIFYNMSSTQVDAKNKFALLFLCLAMIVLDTMSMIPDMKEQQLYIFYRERESKFYSSMPWILSCFIVEFFVTVLLSVIFSFIIYGIAGLRFGEDWELFYFFGFTATVTRFVAYILFFCLAAYTPDVDWANWAAPLTSTLLIVFSGFLITEAEMADFWKAFYYADYLRLSLTAIALNEFNGQKFTCEQRDLKGPFSLPTCLPDGSGGPFGNNPCYPCGTPTAGAIPCTGIAFQNFYLCPITQGNTLTELYFDCDLSHEDKWSAYYELIYFSLGFLILFFVGLKWAFWAKPTVNNNIFHLPPVALPQQFLRLFN